MRCEVSRVEDQRIETTVYSLSNTPPPRDDRRDGERFITLLRVGSLVIDGRRELCLIRNVSAAGMLIRAYCAIPPGTRLSIELKSGQPACGTARWTDGDSVGVLFDDPIDVVGLLSSAGQGPRPRMPRVEVECIATIRHEADLHRVRTLNISQGGVRVSCNRPLAIGSGVTVTLPGFEPQPATVRWNEGTCFGITFNRILPLHSLVPWLQERQARIRAAS